MPLASELEQEERDTLNWHDSRGELSDGTWEGLPVIDFAPRGRDDYFYNATHTKRKLLLHYTMGFLGGDLSQLTRDNFHVSVPFLIARSGKIIRLFDPDLWSFHLGPGAKGGNEDMSKESVAIEINNMGPLERSGSWMWNYYGSRYCRASEAQYYTDLGSDYRGYRYYASFTPEQYASVRALLPKIVSKYAINKTFLPVASRYDMFAKSSTARNFRGICSHVNFRKPSDKTDIGPAFDWPAIGANDDGSVTW